MRQSLLALRARALAKFGEDTVPVNEKSFNIAKQFALRAPSLAKFGEVDTVPVSEKYTKHRGNSVPVLSRHFDL